MQPALVAGMQFIKASVVAIRRSQRSHTKSNGIALQHVIKVRLLARSLACHEIQERKALKVFGLLVAEFNYLVVALLECLYTKPVPCVLVIQLL